MIQLSRRKFFALLAGTAALAGCGSSAELPIVSQPGPQEAPFDQAT